MTLKNNLKDCGCGCEGHGSCNDQKAMKVNLLAGARREMFKNQEHLVVPVVMLRETVVNGGLVTLSELKPQGWNGVPVTIGHPESNGKAVTANSPKIIEQWQVGQIFNAKLEGDKLKAEAWIDIARAESIYSGIVQQLEGGVPMDVSTGYYSTDEVELGVFKDKPYFEVHRDLKPDHLALLPDEEGACNWADGCGVRINKGKTDMSDQKDQIDPETAAGFRAFMAKLGMPDLRTQRRSEDDDFRQMVADLVSNDGSPFTADDEFALREMSYAALKDLRDQYVTKTNSQGDAEMADEKGKTNTAPLTEDRVAEIVTNAVNSAVQDTVSKAVDTALNANKRNELIDKIHDNNSVPKEELAKLSTEALEAMAPKTNKADMSGKGMKTNGDTENVKRFPGMHSNAASQEADKKEA